MYGAIAVERLRTFHGSVQATDLHYQRFHFTCSHLCLTQIPDADHWNGILADLLEKNREVISAEEDISIVVVASPGELSAPGATTMMAYIERIPWATLCDRYRKGVGVCVSKVLNIPESCWPVAMKVRSRLQYYLADLEANRSLPGAIALLLNQQMFVTDTSFATPLLCVEGNWVTPTSSTALPSTTLEFHRGVLKQELDIEERDVHLEELRSLSEMLLVGTTGQLHAVSDVDLRAYGGRVRQLRGVQSEAYDRVLRAMVAGLGCEIVKQADRLVAS